MVDKEDWRIMGQEGYLKKRTVFHKKFNVLTTPIGYRQCEFCYSIFSDEPGKLKHGYHEPISDSWICEDCFQDFKDMFQWTVEEDVDDRDLKEVKN